MTRDELLREIRRLYRLLEHHRVPETEAYKALVLQIRELADQVNAMDKK
jgi:hypothetical protein